MLVLHPICVSLILIPLCLAIKMHDVYEEGFHIAAYVKWVSVAEERASERENDREREVVSTTKRVYWVSVAEERERERGGGGRTRK